MPDIKTNFAVTGEKEYRAALSSINSDLRVLSSEMKLTAERYADNADSIDSLNAKQAVLEKQLTSQRDKVEMTRAALANAVNVYGEADARTKKWQVSLNNAEAELTKTERELKSTNDMLQKVEDSTSELESEFNQLSSSLKETDQATDNTKRGFNSLFGEGKGLSDVVADLGNKFGINLPQGITKSLNSLGSLSAGMVAAAGAAAAVVAALVAVEKQLISLTKEQAAAASQTLDLASTVNMSVEAVQEWDYIFKSVGSSIEEAQGDLSALQEKMRDAEDETSEAGKLFAELGVNVQNADGSLRAVDEVMYDVVTSLQSMEDNTRRNAISSELLSTTGERLAAVYDMQAGSLDSLIEEKRQNGVATEEEIRKLDEVDQAMMRLNDTTDAAKTKIAAQFAPALTEVTNNLIGFIQKAGQSLSDSGIVESFGSILVTVTKLLDPLAVIIDAVLPALNPLLKTVGFALALIADTLTVIVGLVKGITTMDWSLFKQGLGLDPNNPSATQAFLSGDSAKMSTNTYDVSAGGYVGNGSGLGPGWRDENGNWVSAIAGNASGTDNWRGGWTWVGENGPELVNLPRTSQILSAQESRLQAGNTIYNITIDAKNVKEFNDIVAIAQNQRRIGRMGVAVG